MKTSKTIAFFVAAALASLVAFFACTPTPSDRIPAFDDDAGHEPLVGSYNPFGAPDGGNGFLRFEGGIPTTTRIDLASTNDTRNTVCDAGAVLKSDGGVWICGVDDTTGVTPGGTGFRHVTSGAEDGTAKFVSNSDVEQDAGIAVSKLSHGTNGDCLTTASGLAAWGACPGGGGGGANPAGSGSEVQFRLNGTTFAADSAIDIDSTNHRLRTSSAIAFTNGGNTALLSSSPTGSRTLTIPDVTGTLVCRDDTVTLTNKTISATDNTITATSIATGDILVSNGTKFVRQAKCSDGQFWGAASGAAGCYTPSGSSITGTDTQVVFFDGANNPAGDADLVWDKTNNVLRASTAFAVGATPATSGGVRLTNDFGMFARNPANSANYQIAKIDSSGQLQLGDAQNTNVIVNTLNGQGIYLRVNSATSVLVEGGMSTFSVPIDVGANYLKGGTSPSTTGLVRGANASSLVCARNAANSANICASAVDSSNNLFVGSDTSSGSQAANTKIDGSSSVQLQVNGTTALQTNGTNILNTLPVIGDSTPFGLHGSVDLANSANVTLASSQYKFTLIRFTTTGALGFTATLPAPSQTDGSDGYWKMVDVAGNTGALTFAMSSGGTTVAVNNNKKAIIFVHRNIGVIRISPDTKLWKPAPRDPLKIRRPRVDAPITAIAA